VIGLDPLSEARPAACAADRAVVDWRVIAPFAVAAVIGTLAGRRLADRLSGATLVRGFAVMLVAVGLFVGAESIAAL
jgi:uncharacterized membrane protein YfcA